MDEKSDTSDILCQEQEQCDHLTILTAVLSSYIPPQLLRNVDETKIHRANEFDYISQILDNSNNQLRMYGTAKELLEDLSLYSQFPLSRKFFPISMDVYDNTIPEAYPNLKGEPLYCKQDYLFHLQSSVNNEFGLQKIAPELAEYMKKHAERLGGCYEFVKYDHEIFEKIRKWFRHLRALQIIPGHAQLSVPFSSPAIAYEKVDYGKVFDDLILEYPWIFLPNSETKDEKATFAVRIFACGNRKFVMESELYKMIHLKYPDREQLRCQDQDGFLRTIDSEVVFEKYRDYITGIEFFHWVIKKTRHAAVPIATPSGDHCILAADALTEILSRSINAFQIFQKIETNEVTEFIKLLEKYFPPDIDCRCFMSLTTIQKLQEEHDEFWKRYNEKPAKQVRDVGPNGFTAEDLEEELKYLGYTDLFTEITTTTVKQAYSSAFSTKKSSDLTTTDMIRLIENILIEVLIDSFPSLQKFMLCQKHCLHCRDSLCAICSDNFTEADDKIEERKPVPQTEPEIQSDPCSESEPIFPSMDPPPPSDLPCQKCNESREEVIETYRTVMNLEKSLKEKDAELEKLRELKKKSDADHLEMTIKNSQLEKELADKKQTVLELQESKTRQAAKQDDTKEKIRAKISVALKQHTEHLNDILNELVPSTPQDNVLLISLQKTIDKLRDDSSLKLAKEMAEKLRSIARRSPSTWEEINQILTEFEEELSESVEEVTAELESVCIQMAQNPSILSTLPKETTRSE